MHRKSLCRIVGGVVLVGLLAGFFVGCAGADNPTIPDAPALPPPPVAETPPKEAPKGYGSNPKYEEAMERMNNPQ